MSPKFPEKKNISEDQQDIAEKYQLSYIQKDILIDETHQVCIVGGAVEETSCASCS